MTASFDAPENRPEDVARAALDGLEEGRLEVLADADTVAVEAALSGDPALAHPGVVGGGSTRTAVAG